MHLCVALCSSVALTVMGACEPAASLVFAPLLWYHSAADKRATVAGAYPSEGMRDVEWNAARRFAGSRVRTPTFVRRAGTWQKLRGEPRSGTRRRIREAAPLFTTVASSRRHRVTSHSRSLLWRVWRRLRISGRAEPRRRPRDSATPILRHRGTAGLSNGFHAHGPAYQKQFSENDWAQS